MRLYFLFFILLFLSSSLVSAVSFSPTSLIFNLDKNQESCQNITVNSDVGVTVSDKWAETKDVEWNVNKFNTSSPDHDITISYPQEAPSGKNSIKVCLSGANEGEYHGVILLQQAQQGNSIIQLAVWVKAFIGATNSGNNPITDDSGSSNSNQNSNSNAQTSTVTSTTTNTENNQVTTTEETSSSVEENNANEKINIKSNKENNSETGNKITGGTVVNTGSSGSKVLKYIIRSIIVVFALLVVVVLIIRTINIRKRRYGNVY